jgi:hypothetical protein
MRYRRVKVAGATYFFTLVAERRRPILGEPQAVALLGLVSGNAAPPCSTARYIGVAAGATEAIDGNTPTSP